MSKIYNKYLLLKADEDEPTLYIFRSGIFNILIDADAKLASKLLNLKITKLNDNVIKCGFPEISSRKYLEILDSHKLKYTIINEILNTISCTTEYLDGVKFKNIISQITCINMDNVSPIQAYEILHKLQASLSKL